MALTNAERSRNWYYKHKNDPEILARMRGNKKRWAMNNPEKVKASQKASYSRNPEAKRARVKAWLMAHPEKQAAYRERSRGIRRLYRQKKRIEYREAVLNAYGRKCTCCGEANVAFLSIEHLRRDGEEHRRKCHGSFGVLQDIVRRGFPAEFTVLCMNCNWGKRGGECPHKLAV